MRSRLITLYTVSLIPRLSQFQFLKKGRDFRKWPTSPDLCDSQSRQPAASVPKRSFVRFAVALLRSENRLRNHAVDALGAVDHLGDMIPIFDSAIS
jgi:hypothetical protein